MMRSAFLLGLVLVLAPAGCSCQLEEEAKKPADPSRRPKATPTASTAVPTPSSTRPSSPAPKPASTQPSSSAESNQKDNRSSAPSSGSSAAQELLESFAGAIGSFGGRTAGNSGAKPSRSATAFSPGQARELAGEAVAGARKAHSAGHSAAAFKSAVTAYELLAPHAGDPACRELMTSVETDLRRYADAANARPVPSSKPTFIR